MITSLFLEPLEWMSMVHLLTCFTKSRPISTGSLRLAITRSVCPRPTQHNGLMSCKTINWPGEYQCQTNHAYGVLLYNQLRFFVFFEEMEEHTYKTIPIIQPYNNNHFLSLFNNKLEQPPLCGYFTAIEEYLTHWDRDIISAISQTVFLKYTFLNKNVWISLKLSLKF